MDNDKSLNKIYIDGSDTTYVIEEMNEIGIKILSFSIILFSFIAVIGIWGIYGIVIFIIWILKTIKRKKIFDEGEN